MVKYKVKALGSSKQFSNTHYNMPIEYIIDTKTEEEAKDKMIDLIKFSNKVSSVVVVEVEEVKSFHRSYDQIINS